MSFGLSWRADVAPVQTGAHRPAAPGCPFPSGMTSARCWMGRAVRQAQRHGHAGSGSGTRHGHDAPPLGSRLRGNDGLGEGTTEGEGHDGGGSAVWVDGRNSPRPARLLRFPRNDERGVQIATGNDERGVQIATVGDGAMTKGGCRLLRFPRNDPWVPAYAGRA